MKRLNNPRYYTGIVVAITLLLILFSPEIADTGAWMRNAFISKKAFTVSGNPETLKLSLKKKNAQLQSSLDKMTPASAFMVINTTENRFELYKNKEIVREGFCSTGSLVKLKTDSDKHWIFKTPKGRLTIQSKITSPVWIKPDWVFVEEGLPIPPANHSSRYESGVLGDYALSLGRGYLIHGTLYQRLLGMPVTHGCIRLGDDDLEMVYKTLSIGSKVYIF